MRFYTDSRLHAMLETQTIGNGKKKSFWDKAGFPSTAVNGTLGVEVVVNNPWAGSGDMAPFDQCEFGYLCFIRRPNRRAILLAFYLVIDVAAGGTSGWFPDNKGGKPWYDGSLSALFFSTSFPFT